VFRSWIVIWLISLAVTASADIYKYVDEEGVICYTDAPGGKSHERIMKNSISKPDKPLGKKEPALQRDYTAYVHKAAMKYDIAPELIKAVIKTESNGNHKAVSRKGAMGLMQLMPSTATDMNVSNPFNPEENIEGGAKYLRHLLERFNGNLTLALAAYNSGPRTVEKYGAIPPISETREYVRRVFDLYNGKRIYAFSGSGVAEPQKPAPIYKIVLDDGTILFTNATLEKRHKTRL